MGKEKYIELSSETRQTQGVLALAIDSSGAVLRRNDLEMAYEKSGLAGLTNRAESILVHDRGAGRIIAQRHRTGQSTVYRRAVGKHVRFAFEIADLFDDHERLEISMEGFAQLLTFQFCPAPWTIVKGVAKLRPGERQCFSPDPTGTPETPSNSLVSFSGVQDRDLSLAALDASFDECLRDYPGAKFGCLASGGIDSTTNAVYLSRRTDICLLNASFRDGDFDEAGYATFVADTLGVEIRSAAIQGGSDILDVAAASLSEPIGDRAIVPTLGIMRAQGIGIDVIVSGEGGDELWGPPRRFDRLSVDDHGLEEFTSRYLEVVSCTTLDQRRILTGNGALVESAWSLALGLAREIVLTSGARSQFEAAKAIQLATWLPENVLRKDAAVAAATNTPVVFPLIAAPALEFIASLDLRAHTAGCGTKAFLKRHLLDAGLEKIVVRPKHKFKVPPEVWLAEHCLKVVKRAAGEPGNVLNGVVDPGYLDSLGQGEARVIFLLHTLVRWFAHRNEVGRSTV